MTSAEFESWLINPTRRPLVMGVLNVTPDSFSDGGRFSTTAAALDHAKEMLAAGADLLDLGGESTRPGSLPVPSREQIARVVPVIEKLPGALISIDTTRSDVAATALDAGAAIINDISGARDDDAMLPLAASRGVPIVLMHMQGTPRTMQIDPAYADVVAEVSDFLLQRRDAALAAGILPHRILFDPGLGFGKRMDHSLSLLRETLRLASLGHVLLIGASRKKFIGQITGETEPVRRVHGTSAAVAWSVANGAGIVRVHDVGPMVQVVKMIAAIKG